MKPCIPMIASWMLKLVWLRWSWSLQRTQKKHSHMRKDLRLKGTLVGYGHSPWLITRRHCHTTTKRQLWMKLYKFIQCCRNGKDSQSKWYTDDSFSSCLQPSTSSAGSRSRPNKRKIEFSLPRFTTDVQWCIDKDPFYTHQVCNKLIR